MHMSGLDRPAKPRDHLVAQQLRAKQIDVDSLERRAGIEILVLISAEHEARDMPTLITSYHRSREPSVVGRHRDAAARLQEQCADNRRVKRDIRFDQQDILIEVFSSVPQ